MTLCHTYRVLENIETQPSHDDMTDILRSILDDGHYDISPDDVTALQTVITSMRADQNQKICNDGERDTNKER